MLAIFAPNTLRPGRVFALTISKAMTHGLRPRLLAALEVAVHGASPRHRPCRPRPAAAGHNMPARRTTGSRFRPVGVMALLCAASMPLAAFADTSVGTITYTVGTVYVQPAHGDKHLVVTGASLQNGDTIQTGKGAEAVLLMVDQQHIYLNGNTLYRLDDFHYSAEVPAQSYSVTSLLQGGLRVISGLIGKQGNPDAYQLKTQMATIGIRGTEWSVLEGEDGHTGENIRVYHGLIDVRTDVYREELAAGLGTVLHSRQSSITTLPGEQVRSVTPSPAAAACE
jgi:FecR protein